jgi:hypothetical protein
MMSVRNDQRDRRGVPHARKQRHPLEGQYFLSFDANGQVRSQGDVRARVGGSDIDPIFLVVFRDWIMGDVSNGEAVPLSRMLGWLFYKDSETWLYEGARHLARMNRAQADHAGDR